MFVTLSAFVSEKRTRIYAELKSGQKPSEGEYPPEVLKEALVKGEPQLGTTRFEPDAVVLEFHLPRPHDGHNRARSRENSRARAVYAGAGVGCGIDLAG